MLLRSKYGNMPIFRKNPSLLNQEQINVGWAVKAQQSILNSAPNLVINIKKEYNKSPIYALQKDANTWRPVFFTLNLQNRNSRLLTNQIAALRDAFKRVQQIHHFYIDAIVILPEHMHMIMTLPPNDLDYSKRLTE